MQVLILICQHRLPAPLTVRTSTSKKGLGLKHSENPSTHCRRQQLCNPPPPPEIRVTKVLPLDASPISSLRVHPQGASSGCIPRVHPLDTSPGASSVCMPCNTVSILCVLPQGVSSCIQWVLIQGASSGCFLWMHPHGASPVSSLRVFLGCVLWVHPLGAPPGCMPGCILCVHLC